MRSIREAFFGVASAAIWPSYLGLLAYMARVGPWPRGIARPTCLVLAALALAGWAWGVARWALGRGGWFESALGAPEPATRQLERAAAVAIGAGFVLMVPVALIDLGLIASGDRPLSAAALPQLLRLAYELVIWAAVLRLVRSRSALMAWLLADPNRLGGFGRRRRPLAWSTLAALAAGIALDAGGMHYTARRLAASVVPTLAILLATWGVRRLAMRAIDHHAWRWMPSGPRPTPASASGTPAPAADGSVAQGDMADRLRQWARFVIPALGLIALGRVWELDLALFRTIGEVAIWSVEGKAALSVGDVALAAAIAFVTIGSWRHMGTFFTLVIFPRMPDDPGTRFAVLTLCRYGVLAAGTMAGLSSVHLGVEKIGVVLAALGVGLGFGLQEIVANFISGIILLLERPIRVGDVVTVSGMTGTVDRINIRATSITDADNYTVIIPNRSFITMQLINRTHRDKVVRVSIPLRVAPGTGLDRVSDLLLSIARDDEDVLRLPPPSALMESFGEASIHFTLNVFVPDPSLAGRVRHRLAAQIQSRFEAAGIRMPIPAQEIRIAPAVESSAPPPVAKPAAVAQVPPPHHLFPRADLAHVAPTNRCIDE